MDSDITLIFRSDRALLVLAALKVIGNLARGGGEDPDTELTAETFQTYLDAARQAFDADANHIVASVMRPLAEQLERDMLTIIHRNFKRTAEGFERE